MEKTRVTRKTEPSEAIELLSFWFEAGPSKWFAGGDKFDAACEQFSDLLKKGREGKLDDWADTAAGLLALIILLDQIPRNIQRGSDEQFASDERAVELAHMAIERGYDRAYMAPARAFFYMPFMHSEAIEDQRLCCDLFRQTDMKENYHYALIHMDAIARFGRFPHRNDMLGRDTTAEERAYLQSGGFGT